MRSLCVFCGSSVGRRPVYAEMAVRLGTLLAERGVRLIYGGGNIGLMGVLADAALAAGGEAVGVIPRVLLEKELGHPSLTELHVVDSMHQRKALMAELSDAFVALPGGIGTFEEMFEIFTWTQLGLHAKPIGLLEVDGYYRPLIDLLESAVTEGFLRPEHRAMLLYEAEPAPLLDTLAAWRPPPVTKWIEREET